MLHQKLVGRITDRPAYVTPGAERRQEMNAAPEAAEAADVLELGEGRKGSEHDIGGRSDAGLDDRRASGRRHRPSEVIGAEEAAAGLRVSGAEARRTRWILRVIRG